MSKHKPFHKFFKNLIIVLLIVLTAFISLKNYICSAADIRTHDIKTTPLMWNLKHFNEHFVGRKEFLQSMNDYFFKQNNNLLIISGEGGMGKADVIQRYAENHQSIYQIVWWFDVKREIKEQYKNFALEWNRIVYDDPKKYLLQINEKLDEDELIEQVNDRLRITKLNWLIILDKVQEPSDAIKYTPKKADDKSYGHIIISTRNSTLHGNDVMHIGRLKREESIELLFKTTREKDKEAANLLSSTLEDNPLAIARAGLFIASYSPMTIAEYNHLFKNDRAKLQEAEKQLQKQRTKFNSYKATVLSTHTRNIEEVRKESPIAYELLSIVAFLNNRDIPENILHEYFKNKIPNDSTDIKFNNTLSLLMKYSLLERHNYIDNSPGYDKDDKKDQNNKNDRNDQKNLCKINNLNNEPLFKIRVLTQLSLQDMLKNNKESELYLNNAIATLNKLLDIGKSTKEHTRAKEEDISKEELFKLSCYSPHVITLSQNAIKLNLSNSEVRKLHLQALDYVLAGLIDKENSQSDNKKPIQEAKVLIAEIDAINAQELKKASNLATDEISDAYTRLAIASVKLKQPRDAERYLKLHQYLFGEDDSRSLKLAEYFINNDVDLGM